MDDGRADFIIKLGTALGPQAALPQLVTDRARRPVVAAAGPSDVEQPLGAASRFRQGIVDRLLIACRGTSDVDCAGGAVEGPPALDPWPVEPVSARLLERNGLFDDQFASIASATSNSNFCGTGTSLNPYFKQVT